MRKTTTKWTGLFFSLLLAAATPAALGGCDRDEGAFEEAGEAVDEAVEDAEEAAEDATEG